MEFKFGTMSISELGQFISDKLHDDGVKEQAILTVYLNNEEEEIHELLMDETFINEDIKI